MPETTQELAQRNARIDSVLRGLGETTSQDASGKPVSGEMVRAAADPEPNTLRSNTAVELPAPHKQGRK